MLHSLNNFGGPWAIRVVLRCPVPGPGVIQGRGSIGLVCEGLMVGLNIKDTTGELLAVSGK